MTKQESKKLTLVENVELVPFFTKGDSVDSVLEKIAVEARAHVPDVSTDKGRKAITANVTKVTKSKTYLESQGKGLAAEYKAIPKRIDENRRKVKEFLNDLQDEVRLPLTKWEEEQARIKAEEEARIEAEKLAEKVEAAHELGLMMNDNFDREKLEAEELAKQQRIAHEQKIKDEAEAKAQADAQKAIDDAKAAEQKAIRDAEIAEQQRQEQARQAEQARIQAEEQARINAERAERQRIQDQKDAELAAQRAAEQARQVEIQRQQQEEKRIADEKAAREADVENRKSKNNIAKSSLMELGLDEAKAIEVVKAIATGRVLNVTINY